MDIILGLLALGIGGGVAARIDWVRREQLEERQERREVRAVSVGAAQLPMDRPAALLVSPRGDVAAIWRAGQGSRSSQLVACPQCGAPASVQRGSTEPCASCQRQGSLW